MRGIIILAQDMISRLFFICKNRPGNVPYLFELDFRPSVASGL